MKVFVLRNARLESNAGFLRVIDANLKNGHEPSIISRKRKKESAQSLHQESYRYQGEEMDNRVIAIDAQRGAGLKNILPLIKYQFFLFYLLIKNRKEIDLLHAFDLDTGLVSLIFSKIFRKKMVYHIADFYADSRMSKESRLYQIVRKLEYFVMKHSDGTIIANEHRRQQIEGSEPKELAVIHNAPMLSRAAFEKVEKKMISKSKEGQVILSYVGGLTEERFILEVLDFAAEQKNFTLYLAGYGPLEEEVSSYERDHANIHYLGELSYEESLSLYAESDFVFAVYDPKVPNHQYSAPNKVYEAMMLNKPIIVARNSGVDQLVEEREIGIVTDYRLEDFRQKVISLAQDEEKIEAIKENLEAAYPEYAWEEMVERVDSLYKKVEGKFSGGSKND